MWMEHLTTAQRYYLVGGALLSTAAVATFGRWLFHLLIRHRVDSAQAWQFEEQRKIRLRRNSQLYRYGEPLIQDLALVFAEGGALYNEKRYRSISQEVARSGSRLPFRADEFMAAAVLQGLLVGIVMFPIARLYVDNSTAAMVSVLSVFVFAFLYRRSLKEEADSRLTQIKKRFPFCVDLIALMMEAGATFQESLATATIETSDSPAGEVMDKIKRDDDGGIPLRDSLVQLRNQLQDSEMDEIFTAINHSTHLGTPLSEIFLKQADQMRLRRTQMFEKLAGQAKTMMTFPSFVMMFANLVFLVSPFALAFYFNNPMRP